MKNIQFLQQVDLEEVQGSLDIETGIKFTLSDIDLIIKNLEKLKCLK